MKIIKLSENIHEIIVATWGGISKRPPVYSSGHSIPRGSIIVIKKKLYLGFIDRLQTPAASRAQTRNLITCSIFQLLQNRRHSSFRGFFFLRATPSIINARDAIQYFPLIIYHRNVHKAALREYFINTERELANGAEGKNNRFTFRGTCKKCLPFFLYLTIENNI